MIKFVNPKLIRSVASNFSVLFDRELKRRHKDEVGELEDWYEYDYLRREVAERLLLRIEVRS